MSNWGYALDRPPPTPLRLALTELRRQGTVLSELPGCNGDSCGWVRSVTECLRAGQCVGAVIFCADASPACCVANKVKGIRAAKVDTVDECEDALRGMAANVLIVAPANKTYYELKEILRVCLATKAECPQGVACAIRELEAVQR